MYLKKERKKNLNSCKRKRKEGKKSMGKQNSGEQHSKKQTRYGFAFTGYLTGSCYLNSGSLEFRYRTLAIELLLFWYWFWFYVVPSARYRHCLHGNCTFMHVCLPRMLVFRLWSCHLLCLNSFDVCVFALLMQQVFLYFCENILCILFSLWIFYHQSSIMNSWSNSQYHTVQCRQCNWA